MPTTGGTGLRAYAVPRTKKVDCCGELWIPTGKQVALRKCVAKGAKKTKKVKGAKNKHACVHARTSCRRVCAPAPQVATGVMVMLDLRP